MVYDNNAYHNMIISEVILEGDYLIDYLVCQHTYDLLDIPLNSEIAREDILKYLVIINRLKRGL